MSPLTLVKNLLVTPLHANSMKELEEKWIKKQGERRHDISPISLPSFTLCNKRNHEPVTMFLFEVRQLITPSTAMLLLQQMQMVAADIQQLCGFASTFPEEIPPCPPQLNVFALGSQFKRKDGHTCSATVYSIPNRGIRLGDYMVTHSVQSNRIEESSLRLGERVLAYNAQLD